MARARDSSATFRTLLGVMRICCALWNGLESTGDDFEEPARPGCATGFDLSRGCGVGVSASGAECAIGGGRHVAVYADGLVWPGAQWVVRRAGRSGEVLGRRCEAHEDAGQPVWRL